MISATYKEAGNLARTSIRKEKNYVEIRSEVGWRIYGTPISEERFEITSAMSAWGHFYTAPKKFKKIASINTLEKIAEFLEKKNKIIF